MPKEVMAVWDDVAVVVEIPYEDLDSIVLHRPLVQDISDNV